jgi:hypothetical protein
MRVLMWEAKGDVDALLAWWSAHVRPGLPERTGVELFRSADRLVAIVRPVEAGFRLPDPPEESVDRPPHAWPFETVDIQAAKA